MMETESELLHPQAVQLACVYPWQCIYGRQPGGSHSKHQAPHPASGAGNEGLPCKHTLSWL